MTLERGKMVIAHERLGGTENAAVQLHRYDLLHPLTIRWHEGEYHDVKTTPSSQSNDGSAKFSKFHCEVSGRFGVIPIFVNSWTPQYFLTSEITLRVCTKTSWMPLYEQSQYLFLLRISYSNTFQPCLSQMQSIET